MARFFTRPGPCALVGVLVVAATLVTAAPAQADVFQVTTLDDPAPDGCVPGDCSLREAIIEANDEATNPGRDIIVLGPGRHELDLGGGGPENASISGDLDITSEIAIVGEGAGRTSVVQLVGERVFHVLLAGELTLRDLAVAGGDEPADGGGIFNAFDSTVRLFGTTVRNNVTDGDGGGIYNNAGTLVVVDSHILRNHATDPDLGLERGGGIANDNSGTMVVVGTTIAENSAGIGGGIFGAGTTIVRSSEIATNATTDDLGGGGIFNTGADSVVRAFDSTIAGNSAEGGGGGGGIRNFSELFMLNSTVSGNDAHANGGGIETASSDPVRLAKVTVTDNTADDDGNMTDDGFGGGIRVGSGMVSLFASVVTGNVDVTDTGAVDCFGPPASFETLGFNVVGDGVHGSDGCFDTPTASDEGDVLTDQFFPLADNGGPTRTHRLLPGVTAIDQMGPGRPGCGGNDQRGAPRPFGSGCDAGAYELVRCRGRIVNIVGTNGDDNLRGGPGPDGVLAFGGDDAIATGAGNDCVFAGLGDDAVASGDGRDVIFGEQGADTLVGGPGDDVLIGGPQVDVCIPGPGADRLFSCP